MTVDGRFQLLIGFLAIVVLALGLVVWQLYQATPMGCAGSAVG